MKEFLQEVDVEPARTIPGITTLLGTHPITTGAVYSVLVIIHTHGTIVTTTTIVGIVGVVGRGGTTTTLLLMFNVTLITGEIKLVTTSIVGAEGIRVARRRELNLLLAPFFQQ
jgi:hypothetical protein